PTPAKYLIGVDAMCPRHSRNRRALHRRFFDNPPLLRDTAPLPRGRTQRLTLIHDPICNLPGSVHLRSKWTPIRSVHFGRMTSYQPDVQTVITGRLHRNNQAALFCYRDKSAWWYRIRSRGLPPQECLEALYCPRIYRDDWLVVKCQFFILESISQLGFY